MIMDGTGTGRRKHTTSGALLPRLICAGPDGGAPIFPDAYGRPSGASFRHRRSLVVRHSVQVRCIGLLIADDALR